MVVDDKEAAAQRVEGQWRSRFFMELPGDYPGRRGGDQVQGPERNRLRRLGARLDPRTQGTERPGDRQRIHHPRPERAAPSSSAGGQVLRIHQIVGGQVGDCVFYKRRRPPRMVPCGSELGDQRDFSAPARRSPSSTSIPSRRARNAMLTTVADTLRQPLGATWGGRCSTKLYERRDRLGETPLLPGEPDRGARPLGGSAATR